MAKIFLQGEQEAVLVGHADADRILSQKNDPDFKEMIKVGHRMVQKRQVKGISFSDESGVKKYDLDRPEDRRAVRDFEAFIEGIVSAGVIGGPPPSPLDHYGIPFKDQQKFPGMVINELLGGVHWAVVQYAITEGLVSRREGIYVSWAVLDRGLGAQHDTGAYDEFCAKLRALSNLRGRREYAKGKEVEALERSAENEIEEFSSGTIM